MPRRDRPRVLLTGFGPFPKVPVNVSGLLAETLAELASEALPGWDVTAHVLPTAWEEGPRVLQATLAEVAPRIAIHFGVSRKATGFEIETRARNIAAAVPDVNGRVRPRGPLDPTCGPERAATLPASAIVDRLRRIGIPALPSRDAGDYICNAALWHSLAEHCGARTLFVHIPAGLKPPGVAIPPRTAPSRLTWNDALTGGMELIRFATRLPRGSSG